jgi:methionyl-tRNA formyltransferase
MKVVFFGTPHFAVRHLEALIESKIEVVAIVTRPDRPQGRNRHILEPPVKQWAKSFLPDIPILQPEKCSTPQMCEVLRSLGADLFVVVAYGEIIKQAVLDIPPLGAINVHGSLLPKYRGAAPMQRALLHGEEETGITIIKLVLKMDAGDMLWQEKMQIPLDMTLPELEEKLIEIGRKGLLEVLHAFETGQVARTPQDEGAVTFAPKIEPEECRIDWKCPLIAIHNLIRATTPHPGAWCEVESGGKKKRLKILRSHFEQQKHRISGKVFQEAKDTMCILDETGLLSIEEVQLEGKKVMAIAEFLHGFKEIKYG